MNINEGILVLESGLGLGWIEWHVMNCLLCIFLSFSDLRLSFIEELIRVLLPLKFREEAAISFQVLLKSSVVLSSDTWHHGGIRNLSLDSLTHWKWSDIVWQISDVLEVASSKGSLHIVSLPAGVFIEHWTQIWDFIVLHGSLLGLLWLLLAFWRVVPVHQTWAVLRVYVLV